MSDVRSWLLHCEIGDLTSVFAQPKDPSTIPPQTRGGPIDFLVDVLLALHRFSLDNDVREHVDQIVKPEVLHDIQSMPLDVLLLMATTQMKSHRVELCLGFSWITVCNGLDHGLIRVVIRNLGEKDGEARLFDHGYCSAREGGGHSAVKALVCRFPP